MQSGSLPEIEEINFTSSDNKSPIVNCDPPRGQQKWVIVTTSLYNTLDTYTDVFKAMDNSAVSTFDQYIEKM